MMPCVPADDCLLKAVVLKRNKLKMSSSKDSKLFVLNLKKSKFKEGYNFISQLG